MNGILPPRLTRAQITKAAERLSTQYAELVGRRVVLAGGLTFESVHQQYIYPTYGIEFIDDVDLGLSTDGKKILGEYDVERNIAYLDRCLNRDRDDPRRAFTCWHEVGGHGVLQGDWLRSQLKKIQGNPTVITTEASITPQASTILERQANIFAAHAGAPRWLIEHALKRTFNLTRPFRFIGQTKYCFDLGGQSRYLEIGSFSEMCRAIAYYIRGYFGGLSVESIGYQIEESRFVVDETRGFRLPRVTSTIPSRGLRLRRAIPAA